MSISGGAVALLLLGIRPLVRNRLPKTAQYYFWLIALFALLVPVSQIIVLPDRLSSMAPPSVAVVVERNVVTVAEENMRMVNQAAQTEAQESWLRSQANVNALGMQGTIPQIPVNMPITYVQPAPLPYASPSIWAITVTAFMVLYPLMAVVVLMYNLIGYALFLRKLRRSYIMPYKEELELLKIVASSSGNSRRVPRLRISEHAATPMLIGLFRPIIVLPHREYTSEQLHSIFLHELTHMRRFDIAVKWMSLFACAVHWFNPVVWLARREINSICELSCDEAVIRNMDTWGKQVYGNTLIDVATDTKIPLPVLSTTMCEEKRALKERLGAIMKSKKHTKLAILVSILIVSVAVLGACGLGASRNAGNDDYIVDDNSTNDTQDGGHTGPARPVTQITATSTQAIAEQLAQDLMQTILRPHVTVVDYRVNHLAKIAELSEGLPHAFELWEVNFMFQVEYEPFVLWSGANAMPDENGWVGSHALLGDLVTHLVIANDSGNLRLMEHIVWGVLGVHSNAWTPWGAEDMLREYLEMIEMLPPLTFPGNHYIAYAHISDQFYVRALLSQPIRQGDGGVWAVVSWQSLDRWNYDVGTIFPAHPLSETMTMLEFFREQQEGADSRGIVPTTDTALDAFLTQWTQWNDDVRVLGMYPVPYGTANPLDLPRMHTPVFEVVVENPLSETEWPVNFTSNWGSPHNALRASKLEELGGLAFNEAYHFIMDDGRYAVITGWRPMITPEEFRRYYPDFYLPLQAGDFRLVGVTVNDFLHDAIRIYNNPDINVSRFPVFNIYYNGADLPLNEVFVRNLWMLGFHAIYVDSNGVYVSVHMHTLGTDGFYADGWWNPAVETVTLDNLGELYFVGANDRYVSVNVNSERTFTVPNPHGPDLQVPMVLEISLPNPDTVNLERWGWFGDWGHEYNAIGTLNQFSDIVRVFDPHALFDGFNGHIISRIAG